QLASAPTALGQTLPSARPENLAAPIQQAAAPTPTVVPTQAPAATPAPVAEPQQAAKPTPAATPAAEPAMSGNDKFRWPVSGRIITDFAASRGTGINIDVPEGSTVKAAENGTVIYVGSGV